MAVSLWGVVQVGHGGGTAVMYSFAFIQTESRRTSGLDTDQFNPRVYQGDQKNSATSLRKQNIRGFKRNGRRDGMETL